MYDAIVKLSRISAIFIYGDHRMRYVVNLYPDLFYTLVIINAILEFHDTFLINIDQS